MSYHQYVRWHSRRIVCFFVCALAIAQLPSYAQVLYGSLTGNVTDPSGASVPQAKVEALNTGTGSVREALSDANGTYSIGNLQAGTYRVTISAASFGTVVQNDVHLDANAIRRVDVRMQMAQVSQQVVVDASAIALKTDRADVSSQISSSEIANLPLGVDRNFQSLYKLVPGSSPPAPSHSKAGNPTGSLANHVNGQSDTANMTRIDGTADPNFWELNIIAYVPPAEAIEAVNVVTSSYD